MFKALLHSIWYNLSDVRLAEAIGNVEAGAGRLLIPVHFMMRP